MSHHLTPTLDEAELAVDLYCLLIAQVEELRKLAAPSLLTESQRAAFADRVSTRARQLRQQNPEGMPALLESPTQPPAPSTDPLVVYGSIPRRHLSPTERALRESAARYALVQAQTARMLENSRGGAA